MYLRKFLVVTVELNCVSSEIQLGITSLSGNDYFSYKFLPITNLTQFFMYLFISSLYMFRASHCSSSGGRIVLILHLVRLVCVSDCLVCLYTGIPSSRLHRLIIPDGVLIQFDLLMMSSVTLETCREMK